MTGEVTNPNTDQHYEQTTQHVTVVRHHLYTDRSDTTSDKKDTTMIMTVILDQRSLKPVLSLSHNNMDAAQDEADRINEANKKLGYNYLAIVEVIH